jgi:hypothetical protein
MLNINREAHARHAATSEAYADACETVKRHENEQAAKRAQQLKQQLGKTDVAASTSAAAPAAAAAAAPGASGPGPATPASPVVSPAELAAAEAVVRAYHPTCNLRKARSRHASDRWLASVTNCILELCPGAGSPLFCLGEWGACAFLIFLLYLFICYIIIIFF